MSLRSAGILLYRFVAGRPEVLLVHPGGPYWARKDAGAWTIPKGLCEPHESPLETARREFREETGFEARGPFLDLGEIKQPSGKRIHIWASEQDVDTAQLASISFSLEWPRKSGVIREYPEVDRGAWFGIDAARKKILPGQAGFIERLLQAVQRA